MFNWVASVAMSFFPMDSVDSGAQWLKWSGYCISEFSAHDTKKDSLMGPDKAQINKPGMEGTNSNIGCCKN